MIFFKPILCFLQKNRNSSAYQTRKIATSFVLSKFDKEKIKEYEKEIDNLLKLAKEENKNIRSSFYKNKANKLCRRLKSTKRIIYIL